MSEPGDEALILEDVLAASDVTNLSSDNLAILYSDGMARGPSSSPSASDSAIMVGTDLAQVSPSAAAGTGSGEGPFDYIVASDGNTTALYDISQDTWEIRANPPHTSTYPTGATLNDIIYYCGGGASGTSGSEPTWKYDPGSDTWEQLPDIPIDKDYPAGAAAGGAVYSIGGDDENQEYVHKYVPGSGSWEQTPTDPPRNWEGHGTAVIGGKIYICSGDIQPGTSLADKYGVTAGTIWRYDPADDSYVELDNDTPNKYEVQGNTSHQGYVWSMGGNEDGGDDEVRRYDPSTNTWNTNFSPLPFSSGSGVEIASGSDGRIYATYNGSFQAFDPATDTWDSSLSSIPIDVVNDIFQGTNLK
jgi:N-acetylneuraminic acid mutarotase